MMCDITISYIIVLFLACTKPLAKESNENQYKVNLLT